MIEVEKRVLINNKQFKSLGLFFQKNGKEVENFKRFTMVKIQDASFVENNDNPVDLRVRTTQNRAKLVVKYGNWHRDSARQEYEIDFALNNILSLIKVLQTLGCEYFIMTYLHRYVYIYKQFVITLDSYKSMDANLLEVEYPVENQGNIAQSEKAIDDFLNEHQLKSLDSSSTIAFIRKINNIKKLRVDFTKITVENWFKKWQKFIYCQI